MSEDKAKLILQMLTDFKLENSEDHRGIIKRMDIANGGQKENTEHRLKFQGGFSVIKWLLGFVGIGNLIILVKLFILK